MQEKREQKRRSTEARPGGTIDMTSMIDVTFQLIIFFLCLRFKSLEAKLPAYLPKEVGGDPEPHPPMRKLDIHIFLAEQGVRREGKVRDTWEGHRVSWRVNGRPYFDKAALEKALHRLHRVEVDEEGEPLPVTVHAHRGVFYRDVTETVDTAIFQGFREVNFAGGHTR